MLDFALPGLYAHYKINIALLTLLRNHPELFHDNVTVGAVYGIFPFCVFDGGRIFPQINQITREKLNEILGLYRQFEIPIRLICTNNQMKEEDYYDHWGNIVLADCEDDLSQIVVGDDKFAEYVKKNYPKYTFISSTTKCLNKEDFLVELDRDEYFETCLDYNLNHNFKMLEGLTQEQKDRCEFLVNAICPPGCPTRKEHYKLNSLYYLTLGKSYRVPKCGIKNNTLSRDTCNYKNNISYNEIVEKYEPMGFKHFKIEGRSLEAYEVIGNIVNYLAKPECATAVYSELIVANSK